MVDLLIENLDAHELAKHVADVLKNRKLIFEELILWTNSLFALYDHVTTSNWHLQNITVLVALWTLDPTYRRKCNYITFHGSAFMEHLIHFLSKENFQIVLYARSNAFSREFSFLIIKQSLWVRIGHTGAINVRLFEKIAIWANQEIELCFF